MNVMTSDAIAEFRQRGAAIVRGLVDAHWLECAKPLLDSVLGWPDRPRAGMRGALEREPGLVELVRVAAITELMKRLCGDGVMVVRAIVFDKSPDANWAVPWHQDATIAVREKIDVPGFGPWAVKAGEHHCQPPREILDRIITLRVHLDACGPENGPLRVVPGSHWEGLVSDEEVVRIAAARSVVELAVEAGDAVVMYPHVVHSSPRASVAARRRVLHLDCTVGELPGGLRWAEEVELRGTDVRAKPMALSPWVLSVDGDPYHPA